MMVPRIAHTFEAWLPLTMTWAYDQIRFVDAEVADQIVLAISLVAPALFPWRGKIVPAGAADRASIRAAAKTGARKTPRTWIQTLNSAPPDIVFSHFGYRGWRDIPLVRRIGAAHLVRFYGHDVDMFPERWPVWRHRYAELFDKADLILCEGPAMAARLVERGCPEEKVEIVRLGVDLDSLKAEPRRVLPGAGPRFLVAGAFREKKGIPLAVEAFARVRAEVPCARLTIIGDASDDPGEQSEKERILGAIERHHVADEVTLTGFVPLGEMLTAAYDHHVFLAPSITARDGDNEGGAPVTTIQMAATAMPIVASRHRDMPQVVTDGVTGLLAAEGDVDGLAEHMLRLAREPALIPKMGAAGRRLVEARFDVKACAGELAAVYRRLHARSA